MATKKKTGNGKGSALPQAPDGSRSVRSGAADGYFRVEEGAWIQGVILGRFYKQGGNFPGHYYQIRLTKPCDFVQKKDPDGEYYDTEAEPGETISADERSIMTGLQPFAEEYPDKMYEVWIVFEEKQKNKGKTFWKGDARVVGPYYEKPKKGEAKTKSGNTQAADDNVPY